MKTEISLQSFRALGKLLDGLSFGTPYKMTLEDVEVVGEKATLVTLYFDDQRDGEWEYKYILNQYGAVKVK